MVRLQATTIALIALIITPGYLFFFDVTPKIAVLLLGTAAALVVAAFSHREWPSRSGLLRLFSALLAVDAASLLIATALSAAPERSWFGTSWRRFGAVSQCTILLLAWLVAMHGAGRRDHVQTVLRGVGLAGILSAAYGIAQYFGYDPLLPAAAYHVGERISIIVRPPGTLGHASYFATWLLFAIFLSVALIEREDAGRWWRRTAMAASGLSLAAMLLTGTRAAMLGLAAGSVVWLALRRKRPSRRMAAVAAALGAASAAFYFSPAGSQLRSRTRWFIEDPLGGARLSLWRDSLRMSIARPAVGFGPETFTGVFPHFESRQLARQYPDFMHESPHNMFLDALAAQGVPGLAALAGLCSIAFAAARRTGAGFAAALAAGIVSQQFTAFTVPTAVIFFTTMAMAVACGADPPVRSRPPGCVPIRPAALIACVLCAAALAYCGARYTAADRSLALVRRGLDSGDFETAAAQFRQFERRRLPGTAADLWYSRTLLGFAQTAPNAATRLQALALAGAAALRATQTAEDPFNAWYSLAGLYATQNDFQRTESSLRSSIAAHPNWFKPHWTLAQVLALEGRNEEAGREAELAADLNGGKNPEVAQTLADIRSRSFHK